MNEPDLKGKCLLVVDDEADLREIISSEFEFLGARVLQAENVSTAKSLLDHQKIDLIISDIRMPGATGIDLLKYVRSKSLEVPPVILITGFADITPQDAFDQGAEALMSKPFKLEDLIQRATKLVSPIDKRYGLSAEQESADLNLVFDEKLEHEIQIHDCSIGRGGMSIKVDGRLFKWGIGEEVAFHLNFKDIQLKGVAICRWWKPQENSQAGTLGLEFTKLSKPSLEYFQDYWQQHKTISFIPELH
jgi:CheY-like chemotaxis protein